MSQADPAAVLRTSHDRFAALVGPLDDDQVTGPSYDTEWTIADVASHLGSQAEIFGGFLEAGLTGADAPGNDTFGPIWDRWNALAPADQVRESVRANEAFVRRVEGLSAAERAGFSAQVFGMSLDLDGLLGMRLGEHALHTWDVAVALDPSARVADDAVGVVLGQIAALIGRAMKPVAGAGVVAVHTTDPAGTTSFDLGAGTPAAEGTAADTEVTMPGEAFLRLVYGRLDPDHTPAGISVTTGADPLPSLRAAFPGF